MNTWVRFCLDRFHELEEASNYLLPSSMVAGLLAISETELERHRTELMLPYREYRYKDGRTVICYRRSEIEELRNYLVSEIIDHEPQSPDATRIAS